MPHVSLKERFKKLNIEVELGFTAEQAAEEVQRCLNCDVQTVFDAKLCIECDACIDICPVDCLTMTPNGEERAAHAPQGAGEERHAGAVRQAPLKHTGRVMVKDEDLCVHCGLCAERCPTGRLGHAEVARQVAACGRPAVRARRRLRPEPDRRLLASARRRLMTHAARPTLRFAVEPHEPPPRVNDFVIKIATSTAPVRRAPTRC
jgi:ferredoxin